ncbi:hypothetical protein PGTUg99_018286 [Puccinia graminis f. sp. tritici]|uniref:Uncharacterized protein n=1 Tax=Puccinia graminis f. sp. tritici TaxID=56615 RepID=A0A5B0NZD6_PUCGR|nr:hypothetical protein PGTUg99_018286 [Puccinia graminis f. sp. tritici]
MHILPNKPGLESPLNFNINRFKYHLYLVTPHLASRPLKSIGSSHIPFDEGPSEEFLVFNALIWTRSTNTVSDTITLYFMENGSGTTALDKLKPSAGYAGYSTNFKLPQRS